MSLNPRTKTPCSPPIHRRRSHRSSRKCAFKGAELPWRQAPLEELLPKDAQQVLTSLQASIDVELPPARISDKTIRHNGQQLNLTIVQPAGALLVGRRPPRLVAHVFIGHDFDVGASRRDWPPRVRQDERRLPRRGPLDVSRSAVNRSRADIAARHMRYPKQVNEEPVVPSVVSQPVVNSLTRAAIFPRRYD